MTLPALESRLCATRISPREGRGGQLISFAWHQIKDGTATRKSCLLQGLYALFLYEGYIGSGSKAYQYFMRPIEVYNALNQTYTHPLQRRKGVDKARLLRDGQATSWCLWGFYCAEW